MLPASRHLIKFKFNSLSPHIRPAHAGFTFTQNTMKVSVYYYDSGKRVHLLDAEYTKNALRCDSSLFLPVREWITRGIAIRSPWGKYTHGGVTYEYEYGNAASVRNRMLLGLPVSGKLSEGTLRRAYNQSMARLDVSLAERLGPDFVELCECQRSEIELAAQQLAEELGVVLVDPVIEKKPRENHDLDAIFA